MVKPKEKTEPHVFQVRKDNLVGKISEYATCVKYRWREDGLRREKKWTFGKRMTKDEALEKAYAHQDFVTCG